MNSHRSSLPKISLGQNLKISTDFNPTGSQATTFEVDMLNSEMAELDFKITELKEQIKTMKNTELMRVIKGKG